jgi:hypothetical protein
MPKHNGVWDIGPLTLFDCVDDSQKLTVVDNEDGVGAAVMLRTQGFGDRVGPFVFLTPESCIRLEQYLKKCRQNFFVRRDG